MKIIILHWHGVCPHCGEVAQTKTSVKLIHARKNWMKNWKRICIEVP